MTQKVQTILIDDLDGSQADSTVRFGLDGTDYEIDLNADHAHLLRGALALARYVNAARRTSNAARHSARTAQGTGERIEHHQGPRVSQGARYRRQGPRKDTR